MEMALVGQFGFWQILVIIVLVVLLFGRGKISQLMGDAAKGINAFKRGMRDSENDEESQRAINEGGPTVEARPTEARSGSANANAEQRGNS